MSFLERQEARDLRDTAPAGISAVSLFLGRGAGALEVAHFDAGGVPSGNQLKELHERRQTRRATPVVIVVTHGTNRATIATRFGDEWSISTDRDRSQVERLCEAALDAPDRHAADSLLRSKLPQLEQPVPGLRNAGLFAMHELERGVRARADWTRARESARPLLALRGRELVERLGYTIEQTHGPHAVLRARGTRIAVAVFLERSDEIEPANDRYDGLSPVSYALAKADAEHLDYVLMVAGTALRVYPVKPGVGTARRGRTETFVEMDLALLDDAHAGYLALLASADALLPDGTFAQILETSKRFAADLAAGLRDRVYEHVMPELCVGLFRAQRLRNPSREKLQETLDMALLTLFRLLFVAYAEDKELLPYNTSETYREHSLKHIAQRLANEASEGVEYGSEDFYWTEVVQLWKAIEKGNPPWKVPAYNGGLFASGEDASRAGGQLTGVSLPDRIFAPALGALLLEKTAEDVLGPVDFRALGVREFGTIYEGLLEQELSVAKQDLAVDANGAYVPAGQGRRRGRGRRADSEDIVVHAGEPYLHDKSGARKASGAYYTKDFAVEHLLERALEPALADHFARLDAIYDDREKADRFFDFHVADIAMGSGHFLVAAVDHLERGLSNYLANKRQLPGVRDELERLRKVAVEALGKDWRGEPIEDTQLLRRQIARRCIHGVDLNPLAVELARLSLWIHTFVPGLPLSFLDANLVVGNSLVGIATFDEARELIGAEAQTLFSFTAEEMLANAREPVARLAKLAEATAAEVRDARKLYRKMREEVRSTEDLFTVLAASRVDDEIEQALDQGQVTTRLTRGDLFSDRMLRRADKALEGLKPLHFPTAFPQVFLRERPGFDVIIGNPPWEKLHVEEHEFWARHFAGYRGLTQAERERRLPEMRTSRPDLEVMFEHERTVVDRLRNVILSGPFAGMGTGHPDLYKAFCWRFWSLIARDGGCVGVVLPRAVFAAMGSTEFRSELFAAARHLDLTMLVNNQQWVFPEVHPQYTIALVAVTRSATRERDGADIVLDGPFNSYPSFVRRASRVAERAHFRGAEVTGWNDSGSLPLLPAPGSAEVFLKLRRSPRLDLNEGQSWRARPVQGDVNAVSQKEFFDFDSSATRRRWPVIGGEAFDLWTLDTARRYAVADSSELTEWLNEKRERSARLPNSPFAEFPADWVADRSALPCLQARIAFRDVTRATDTRTVRVALVPPKVFLTHTAPFFLWPRGDHRDQAFLLGVLSSMPLDWYARRFVETHLTFFVLNPFPIPRPPRTSPLWQAAVSLSARLAVQNEDRFEEWGAALGVAPAPIAEDEKTDLIHKLDAAVAHLYGLGEPDLVHIFETFHQGWEYEGRLRATLEHFARQQRVE
jgi:hypothetical protein